MLYGGALLLIRAGTLTLVEGTSNLNTIAITLTLVGGTFNLITINPLRNLQSVLNIGKT